ncbi:MAG: tyrosine-type recombinase/integrase [Rhodomicrobiaceae bacterium]
MDKKSFRAHINKTVVERLQPGDTVYDTSLKGFGVRRQRLSASYFLKTCIRGKQKFITIGRHGLPWTPDTARRQAMAYKVDPLQTEKEKETALSLSELVDHFKQSHYPNVKPSTRREYSAVIDKKILPILGKVIISEISRPDITKLHHKYAHTPRYANVTLKVISLIMSWAEGHGYRPLNSNPCKGIKRFTENKVERYLSKEELSSLGAAIDEAENYGRISLYAAAAIRLLIFTGARKGEILGLKWEYIDFEKQIIFLPDSKTGAKSINLNEPAILVLQSIPRQTNNPYVIVGKVHGQSMVNIQKPWIIVRDTAGLKNFRIHDLRHSFASVAAESGASLLHIGKLLGHKKSATTERYAHIANNPVKELNENVGNLIKDTMKNI